MFGSIFNKLHGLLTNRAAKQEFRAASNHVYDSLFDGPEDPWYVDVYSVFYRFFKYGWRPSDTYRRTKWTIQRARRGWSDRDCWSYSSHFLRTIPDILRYLKEHQHGVPYEFCVDTDVFSPTYGQERDDEQWGKSGAKWNAVLEKLIAGFETGRRYEEMDYDEELGEHPFRRPVHISQDAWEVHREDYMRRLKVAMKRDEEILQETLLLFKQHFWNLCD